MYIKNKKTSDEIGKIFNVSGTTIRNRLKKYNLLRNKGFASLEFEKHSIINNLLILCKTKERKNGEVVWECKCVCGKKIKATARELKGSRIKSCGCRGKGRIDILPGYFHTQIENNMKKKGFYDIDYNFLCNLYKKQNGKCNLSGLKIEFAKNSFEHGYQQKTTASLDRIKNHIGYIKENVHWVHKDINKMKYIYEINYFIKTCNSIITFDKKYNKRDNIKDVTEKKYKSIERKAKEKNILFNISYNFLNDLYINQNGMCALSGNIINEDVCSLDRFSSNEGYIPTNVQWIHKDINFMKNKIDQKKFIEYCTIISNYNKGKTWS